MNQKQPQRFEPAMKLRKLNNVCIHKDKYISSHPTCQANAQMCSQKCPRSGHLDQPHDIMEIQQLLGKVKQLKQSKIEITSYLFELLESSYKQQQQHLYNRYREAKNKIQILCFQDDDEIKLIETIDVGKFYQLVCSHIYYLKNIAVNKEQIAKQAEDIIKKFKEGFATETKSTSLDQNKERLVQIVSVMKNHFKNKLDQERKSYFNKYLDLESTCRKIQSQSKMLKKKYEKAQSKLNESYQTNRSPVLPTSPNETITPANQSAPKKQQPSQKPSTTTQNKEKPNIKDTNQPNIKNPFYNPNSFLYKTNQILEQRLNPQTPPASKLTSGNIPEPRKPKLLGEDGQIKQKIKQKILREKQQKMKSAQKNQQTQNQPRPIIFKPLTLVNQQQKTPAPPTPTPTFPSFQIPIKQTKGFAQATNNIQNTSFSLFMDRIKNDQKLITKIGQEIKLPKAVQQQQQPKAPTEQNVPRPISTSAGIFQKHRQYEQQKKQKQEKQKKQVNKYPTFNLGSYTFTQISNQQINTNSLPTFNKKNMQNKDLKQEQSEEEQFGLFDKQKDNPPKPSSSQGMQDKSEANNFIPVFTDSLSKNSNEGFFFKKKMEPNANTNTNTNPTTNVNPNPNPNANTNPNPNTNPNQHQ